MRGKIEQPKPAMSQQRRGGRVQQLGCSVGPELHARSWLQFVKAVRLGTAAVRRSHVRFRTDMAQEPGVRVESHRASRRDELRHRHRIVEAARRVGLVCVGVRAGECDNVWLCRIARLGPVRRKKIA